MAEIRIIADGLRFPEGPVAMADGSVVLGEIAGAAGHPRRPRRRQDRRSAMPAAVRTVVAHRPRRRALCLQQWRRRYTRHGELSVDRAGARTISGGYDPAHRPADRRHHGCSTASATATNCRRRTTSCSTMPRRLLVHRPGQEQREHDNDRGAVYYTKADGSKIEQKVFPLLSGPTAAASRPTRRRLYVVETPTARLLGLRPFRARRSFARIRANGTLSRTGGPRDCGPRRLPDVRFAGGQFGPGPHLRRHPDHRRGLRHLTDGRGGAPGQDAGRLPDQHLLWRRRHENRLHHPLRRPASSRRWTGPSPACASTSWHKKYFMLLRHD